jgi:hypothetical protein
MPNINIYLKETLIYMIDCKFMTMHMMNKISK